MANPEHVATVKRGAEANKGWRRQSADRIFTFRDADLSGADLRKADLSGADFRDADLSGADLRDADLSGSDFRDADLSRADLRDANLSGVNLRGAGLGKANLSGANLTGANLSATNFHGANLSRANIRTANLTRADLSGANLHMANLSEATLSMGDLRAADLRVADLRKADLTQADLRGANLSGANLVAVDLRIVDLSGANASGTNLSGANLRGANLAGMNLNGANLNGVNLCDVDLTDADLRNADLNEVNLSGANLCGADLSEAQMRYAVLARVDLRTVKGLASIRHFGPSTLGIDSTVNSKGEIPEVFLRGCGVPDIFIQNIRSLTNLPIQYYSCFISYSTKDQDFAERVYNDLQAKDVRCWFAPHDMQGGKEIHKQIDEAIRFYDKLLLILSPTSITSEWVNTEIAKARKRELSQKKKMLFPLRLVNFETLQQWEYIDSSGTDVAEEILMDYIPDFSQWKSSHDAYAAEFEKLLRDLKAEASG